MEDNIKLPLYEKLNKFDKAVNEYVKEYNKLAETLIKTKENPDPLKIKKIRIMQADFFNCEEILLAMHPELKDDLEVILKDIKIFMSILLEK